MSQLDTATAMSEPEVARRLLIDGQLVATGTTFPILRLMNKSPGPVPRIRSGTMRESAQVINSAIGRCWCASL